MHNTNHVNAITETLLDSFFEVTTEDKKVKDKDSAKRRLQTRRAIEDYHESKRLRQSIEDFYE